MKCIVCGTTFHCGMQDREPCWCSTDFPAVMPVPTGGVGCLCPRCLADQVRQRLDDGDPTPSQKPPQSG